VQTTITTAAATAALLSILPPAYFAGYHSILGRVSHRFFQKKNILGTDVWIKWYFAKVGRLASEEVILELLKRNAYLFYCMD